MDNFVNIPPTTWQMNVDMFIPCFIDQLHPHIGNSVLKILEKVKCNVRYNPKQTCCGQPAFNSGYWQESKEVAKKFIQEFRDSEYVVTPSCSCTGMVRNYYSNLFHNTEMHNEYKKIKKTVYELTEFLINVVKIDDIGAEFNSSVVIHESCSGLRECKLNDQPLRLLQKVKGIKINDLEESETCCGFGGTFAVKYEAISVGMAKRKIQKALDTEAEYIVSTDISCLMHLESIIKKDKIPLKTIHIADVLASGW